MSTLLELIPHDPLIARDGRPFGEGQGNRMRGLPWPLPSVVAGSFRTALVKATTGLDFSGDMPERLFQIAVAGVFPVYERELYLPAPHDAVAEPDEKGKEMKAIHRVSPQSIEGGGCDFPNDLALKPVMLPNDVTDFKPAEVPAWWPVKKYVEWLTETRSQLPSNWFDPSFLSAARQEIRDHVVINEATGANKEGEIFSTAGLNVTFMPRFGVKLDDKELKFEDRFAKVALSARITIPDSETALKLDSQFDIWHPLGGERRMVHWKKADSDLWKCPDTICNALKRERKVRMVLATPAIFKDGWKPGWLTNGLEGELAGVKLKLIGVSNGRWKAVSGWSLQPHKETGRPGPKKIRRMVPAGSVYFFEVLEGDASQLAVDLWLQSVSDDEQERRDGFGLAVWGMWNNEESK